MWRVLRMLFKVGEDIEYTEFVCMHMPMETTMLDETTSSTDTLGKAQALTAEATYLGCIVKELEDV